MPALIPQFSLEPDLGGLTAAAVYLVVFGFVFVESGLLVGFFLPGDSLLFGAGLVAARPESGVSLPVLVVGVVLAAVSGDAVGYAIGARAGRPYLDRRVGRGRLDPAHLRQAERFYARYGWSAVVVARFVPWVRTFTPVLAGVSRMGYPRFAAANVGGAMAWGAGLVVLGYLAAGVPALRVASYAVAAFFVVGSFVVLGSGRWMRRRREAGGRREPGR